MNGPYWAGSTVNPVPFEIFGRFVGIAVALCRLTVIVILLCYIACHQIAHEVMIGFSGFIRQYWKGLDFSEVNRHAKMELCTYSFLGLKWHYGNEA